jgi:hypothetical protein
MNDFTKDELHFLLRTMRPFNWLWQDDPLKLEEKIQSMIDKYCEHPESYEDFDCQPIRCKTCLKVIGE